MTEYLKSESVLVFMKEARNLRRKLGWNSSEVSQIVRWLICVRGLTELLLG